MSLYPDRKSPDEQEDNQHTITNSSLDTKSPGVLRIEAISSCFTKWHRWVLFISVFLLAYAYGLDGTVRYTFQVYAVASFGSSAQISTVSVVRAIVAAAAQPVYAKISDYFGRISILVISVFFYVIGTIVSAAAKNLSTFSGGAMLYQFGYTGTQLLVEVIIADTTSLRSRLFFSYIPAMPFLVNAWVSGNIAQVVMDNTTWQWGIGMWAIIFPVLTIPLFYALLSAEFRAKRQGLLNSIPSPFLAMGGRSLWIESFWQIDVIGLLLLAASLSLILLPFTLAGGTGSLWKTAHVIAPLVVGVVVALPAFLIWEIKFARYPVIPFQLLRDRQIIAALLIAMLLNTAWYTQGDYLYYTLVVAFNRSIESATRVLNIYSFTSVVIGICVGIAVRYVRRLKYFIVAGTLLFVLAFGLLIRYRGGTSITDFAGLVGAEVILGIAGGMFPYPTQTLIQSAVTHERTAIVTSLYLASYSVGSALGNTIAAAIWTNTLPQHLQTNLAAAGIANATEEAASAYADPFTYILTNPVGSVSRDAVDLSYRQVQRYLTICGICISSLLVFLSLTLRDPKLGDTQSLDEADKSPAVEDVTEQGLNNGSRVKAPNAQI